MYISEITMTKAIHGLRPFKMNGLGRVVLLAGRNGSGKSRLLKLLMQYQNILIKNKQGGPLSEQEKDILNAFHPIIRQNERNKPLDSTMFGNIHFLNYSQYDLPLQPPDHFPPYVISVAKENLRICDFEESARDTLLYLKYLAKYYRFDPEKEKTDDLAEFNKLLKNLLGTELVTDDKEPTLFGQPFDNAQLSPGQKYLLRMCVALHCNKVQKNSILLLDEPETHLHPDALLNLIDKLQEMFPIDQIWIATHSVALLSMFDGSKIWHLDGGTIKKLGSKSSLLMKSLLGSEAQWVQFQEFISIPFAFACNEFAFECLFSPGDEPYKRKDPQISLAMTAVTEEHSSMEKVRTVVDFGAGQGRFLDGVGIDYPDRLALIDYYAYDKYPDHRDLCIDVMSRYGLPKERYFNDLTPLKKNLSNGEGAAYVLMVNVLHEIPPKEWVSVFTDIISLLRDDGKLVMVEAEELRYGEKPYAEGFLVVQESSMPILLNNGEFEFSRDKDYERVVCYQIPKASLKKITEDSVRKTVEEIGRVSFRKIQELRMVKEDERSWLTGIEHAFWTHQFANAQLVLADENSAEKV